MLTFLLMIIVLCGHCTRYQMIHYIDDIMQIRWYEEETASTLEAFGEKMLYKIL